jgi:NAD(P)-dependent dehydrogenase (short-subunit alcohol dehydrogenase family)
MTDDLRDLRVLVTAAGRGIGLATARAFADAGARVHVCDVDPERLAAVGRDHGFRATLADVTDPDQVEALFDDALADLGGLDVLVNSAGIAGPVGPVEDVTVEEWRRTVAVNLDGTFLCAQRAVAVMKAQGGGLIVNLASTAGLFGYPLRTPYAAAKWAVVGFTKSLAMEVGAHGIRVNAICPGSVEGERMVEVIAREAETRGIAPEAVREAYVRNTSRKTFVTAADVAAMIVYLASPAGARISGQALAVDGDTWTLGD